MNINSLVTGRLVQVMTTVCFALGGMLTQAAQPLETEDARLPARGHGNVQGAVEWQTSPEGTESAVPLVLDYGVTDRFELSLEPVVFTSINPDVGKSANGIGDIEVTAKWLALPEHGWRPALALAGEVKVPTASNDLIGTGEWDYRAIVIGSKRFGKADVHANLGYTFVGSPPGTQLDNLLDYALAVDFHVNTKLDLVAEVIGNTSSLSGAEAPDGGESTVGGESTITPEAAGNETVGLIGARYSIRPNIQLAFGVTYDNNNAWLLRPGITWLF